VTIETAHLATLRERASAANVSLAQIGRTRGRHLKLGGASALSVAELRERHEGWFPRFMA
jgi:phosphoribosylformylglycinamidine synthase